MSSDGVPDAQHGGLVWSRCHGNVDQPLRPDTRSWPLPWIAGDVMLRDELGVNESYQIAADGVQGEVVIRQRYPYQALTVWASAGFGQAEWRGDVQRWGKYFVPQVGYVQGDAAVRYKDGAFTFHGRSDEVINVGGNRIGTEEIEGALLVDTQRADSPLRNAVIVGMPDTILGTVPCAFITLQPGAKLAFSDEARLRNCRGAPETPSPHFDAHRHHALTHQTLNSALHQISCSCIAFRRFLFGALAP